MKIDSQKYMGENQLVSRLASQVGTMKLAVDLLKKRGDMTNCGKLTEKGKQRNSMTAEQRAIDRASKKSKHDPSEYRYNPLTNRATLK